MKLSSKKIVRLSNLSKNNRLLKNEKNLVFCYGSFNIIHPGHLRYFQNARKYGKKLYVAIEGDAFINKKDLAQQFNELERAEAVSALEFIDKVIILDNGELFDLVKIITPKTLILGKEFERERSEQVNKTIKLLESKKSNTIFETGEVRYANLDIFHRSQPDLETQRIEQFKNVLDLQKIDIQHALSLITKKNKLKILIIGDTIVDQYVACDAIGMSAEAPVVVVRELESQEYLGGAAIVASHVQALGGLSKFISVVGKDENAKFVHYILKKNKINNAMFEDKGRPTTFKIRYMVENQKLFRVSKLKEHGLSKKLENKVIQEIESKSSEVDGIIVSDFVYGFLTTNILKTVIKISKQKKIPLFGDLQCSSQIGNILKFKNFKLICPTEREARIALNNHEDGIEWVSNNLIEKTGSKNLIIKLGAAGFIAYDKETHKSYINRQHFPALTVNPVDITGAGDSLLATISIAIVSGCNLMQASALATCAASLAVQNVGNMPVSIASLKKFIQQIT